MTTKRTLRTTLIGTVLLTGIVTLNAAAYSEAEQKSLKLEVPADPALPADQLAEKVLEWVQNGAQKTVQPQEPTAVVAPKMQQASKPAAKITSKTVVKKPVVAKTTTKTVNKTTTKTVQVASYKTQTVKYAAGRSYILKASAYNSIGSQTDNTPHITATGARTRFGVIALSRDMLRGIPYGSRVRIEDLGVYGSGRNRGYYNRLLSQTVFVVQDTMHPRKYGQVDIWMASWNDARRWGVRQVRLTVLK